MGPFEWILLSLFNGISQWQFQIYYLQPKPRTRSYCGTMTFFLFPCILSTSDIQHTHTSPTHAPSLGRVRAEGNHRITEAPAHRQGGPQHQQAPGETWTESTSSFAHDCRSVTGSASKTSSWGTEAAPTSIPRELADDDPSPQGGMIFSSQQSQTMASSLTIMSLKRASCTF